VSSKEEEVAKEAHRSVRAPNGRIEVGFGELLHLPVLLLEARDGKLEELVENGVGGDDLGKDTEGSEERKEKENGERRTYAGVAPLGRAGLAGGLPVCQNIGGEEGRDGGEKREKIWDIGELKRLQSRLEECTRHFIADFMACGKEEEYQNASNNEEKCKNRVRGRKEREKRTL
jgi:hypothetical protein